MNRQEPESTKHVRITLLPSTASTTVIDVDVDPADASTNPVLGNCVYLTFQLRPSTECEGCAEWIKDIVVGPGTSFTPGQLNQLQAALQSGPGVKGSCLSSAQATVWSLTDEGPEVLKSASRVLVVRKTSTFKPDGTLLNFVPQEIWVSKNQFNDKNSNPIREKMEDACEKVLGKPSGCP
jgi:hypothetical protein